MEIEAGRNTARRKFGADTVLVPGHGDTFQEAARAGDLKGHRYAVEGCERSRRADGDVTLLPEGANDAVRTLRSEERRVGHGGASTCRSRLAPSHKSKQTT